MNIDPFKAGNARPEDEFGKDIEKSILKFAEQVREILNKGIRLEDNGDFEVKTVTTDATPGTEVAVTHTLKRVPLGFIVYSKNKAGDLYDGSTPNTATTIYIRSDVASVTAKILIV